MESGFLSILQNIKTIQFGFVLNQFTYPINQSTVSRRYSGNRSSLLIFLQTYCHWEIFSIYWHWISVSVCLSVSQSICASSVDRLLIYHWPEPKRNQNVSQKIKVVVGVARNCNKKRGHFSFRSHQNELFLLFIYALFVSGNWFSIHFYSLPQKLAIFCTTS